MQSLSQFNRFAVNIHIVLFVLYDGNVSAPVNFKMF